MPQCFAASRSKVAVWSHPAAVDPVGNDAAESVRRGRTGLPELPRPDATHRMDYAAPRHHHSPGMANRTASATPMAAPEGRGYRRCQSQRHPCLRRSQSPTAVARLKNPENLEGASIPITKGSASSAYFLTRATEGRINKQESTHAKPLEREIRPRQPSSLSFFNPGPAPNSGTHKSGPTK